MIGRRATIVKVSAAVVVALFVGIQFVPTERTNPEVQTDLLAPPGVKAILVRACYDCHSHETKWPWYSRIAPLSWSIAGHVRDGRKDLNFSVWPTFDFVLQELTLREMEKQVAGGAMPPRSYRLGHPEARLSGSEKQILLEWIRGGFGDDEDLPY